jgi:hypothetical protein
MQFGFKVTHSTSMCSMILKETIEHYRRDNSTEYCVMLDATKAFDRVNYVKLVRQLFKKKLPVIIIRILVSFYLGYSELQAFSKFSSAERCSSGCHS